MIKVLKNAVGDMFAYKYDKAWYCCLAAYKNVWSQFPMASNSDVMLLFTKSYDEQPDMPDLTELLSGDVIAFRTVFPKRKPKQYVYIGEYIFPRLDVGLRGEGVFISNADISEFEIDHTIIKCENDRNIAVPYYDLKGSKLDHVPQIKVGNSIFHCTKGIDSIIEMYNNNSLDII